MVPAHFSSNADTISFLSIGQLVRRGGRERRWSQPNWIGPFLGKAARQHNTWP